MYVAGLCCGKGFFPALGPQDVDVPRKLDVTPKLVILSYLVHLQACGHLRADPCMDLYMSHDGINTESGGDDFARHLPCCTPTVRTLLPICLMVAEVA